MKGSFSEESLKRFTELASQTQAADFSEGEVYDFTRCVRPNGTAYGTGGTCRKGTEGAAQEKKAINDLGSMLPKGEKIVDSKGGLHTAAGGKETGRIKELTDEIKTLQSMADKARKNGFMDRAVDHGKKASKLIRERADLRTKSETAEKPRVTATPGMAARVKAAKEKLNAEKAANGGKRLDRIQEERRLEQNRAQRERGGGKPNARELALGGVMHPDMARGLKPGERTDFYDKKTGDKISGRVTANDGKTISIKADKPGQEGAGSTQKFRIATEGK